MKQKNLFLLVGPPASGKSTFLAKMMPMLENARCISRDDIRFALVAEDEPYFCREDEVLIALLTKLERLSRIMIISLWMLPIFLMALVRKLCVD